ncbi:hypothetical protein CBM2634_B120033 [Cupriavidus taiwanensis]|uniref:Uncharacterized protein n=1 Tax=Cupriavidus taiwanensis TaxID=164546 RepID=A0A375J790_9BURK|nr:hypothetical protein CBM2634_B120033 [Cupriavidus taiwanensis]
MTCDPPANGPTKLAAVLFAKGLLDGNTKALV